MGKGRLYGNIVHDTTVKRSHSEIVCQGTAKGVNNLCVYPVVCADAKVTGPTMTPDVQIFAQSSNSSLDTFEDLISVDNTQTDISYQNTYNLDDVKIPAQSNISPPYTLVSQSSADDTQAGQGGCKFASVEIPVQSSTSPPYTLVSQSSADDTLAGQGAG